MAFAFAESRDHEGQEALSLASHAKGALYGDSAYRSAKRHDGYEELGLRDETNERPYRNKPLTARQIEAIKRLQRVAATCGVAREQHGIPLGQHPGLSAWLDAVTVYCMK